MNVRRARFVIGVGAVAIAAAMVPARSVAQPGPVRAGAAVQTKRVALVGATVHTGTGQVFEGGLVTIDGRTIERVGMREAAGGFETIDVTGKVITPGFIDAMTGVGLVEVDLEPSSRDDKQVGGAWLRAAYRASDGYNPASVVIPVTRAEGITSVGVVPAGGLVSGQSAFADLIGATATEALAAPRLALHVRLDAGMLGDGTGGHATALLRLREAFDDARTYRQNRGAYERNQSRAFAPSRLDLEALVGALDGGLPVVFHVDRAADILAAIALAKEFKLKPVVAGGAEAWKVARALADAKVAVFVNPFQTVASFDAIGARDDNAAILGRAGVAVALSTFETHHARRLRQAAGNAVRAGLPYEAAIVAVTRAPAEALGMGATHGVLARGRAANVVVWSGDPFEVSTRVEAVYVRGERVSLRSRQTELFERYRTLSR